MRNYNKPKSTMSLFVFISTMLSILSGLLLSSHVFAANTGNMNASVNITAACSLYFAGTNFSTSVIPGNSVLIGTSTVTSICNDPSGLAVYVVGYTNDSYGNNNLTATINETAYNIPASTSAASRWNMTIKGVTGTYAPTIVTTFDNTAQPIPDQYTKVAYRNTITDIGAGATGAKFTTDFNAQIDMTQPAGTYVGKVKFLLIHPNVLTYDDQTGEPDTLAPNTFIRDPEIIVGDCSANSPYLQDVATWGNTVTLGQTVDAIDSRDNQCYKVKRLKMNAAGTETTLWMSNLNLGAEPLTVTELDSSNTHIASGVSAIPATTFNTWIKSSGTGSRTDPELIPIKSSNTCAIYDSNWNSSTVSCPEQDSYGNKYGVLYNYAAASAGTYAHAEDDGNAEYDLCPTNWRLPTGGNAGEFKALVDAYNLFDYNNWEWNVGGFTTTQQDLGFSLAGWFDYDAPSFQGMEGHYWSSTLHNIGNNGNGSMYELVFGEEGVYPEMHDSRGYYDAVRCIAQ